jgi:hypothetical protein
MTTLVEPTVVSKRFHPTADNIIDFYLQSKKAYHRSLKADEPTFVLQHDDVNCECNVQPEQSFCRKCFHCMNLYRLTDFERDTFSIEVGKYRDEQFHYDVYPDAVGYVKYGSPPAHLVTLYESIKDLVSCETAFPLETMKFIYADPVTNGFITKLAIENVMLTKGFEYYVSPLCVMKCHQTVTEVYKYSPRKNLLDYIENDIKTPESICNLIIHLTILLRSLRRQGFIFDEPSLDRFVIEEGTFRYKLGDDLVIEAPNMKILDTKGCSMNIPYTNYRVAEDTVVNDELMFLHDFDIDCREEFVSSGCGNMFTYTIKNKNSLETLLKLKKAGIPLFYSSFDFMNLMVQLVAHPNVYDRFITNDLGKKFFKSLFFLDEYFSAVQQIKDISSNYNRKTINREIYKFLIGKRIKCNLVNTFWDLVCETSFKSESKEETHHKNHE